MHDTIQASLSIIGMLSFWALVIFSVGMIVMCARDFWDDINGNGDWED